MKARDVSFFKKNAWKGTYSSILTIPVESLADKCFGAWLDIEDTNFAEATLPDEKLAGRFRELVDSDAEQAEWDEFYASVGKAFSAMSVDELASKFVELNDLRPSVVFFGVTGTNGISIPIASMSSDRRILAPLPWMGGALFVWRVVPNMMYTGIVHTNKGS